MSLGLNNNFKNTKCTKVRSLGLITSYITNEIIDKSQDLKRYFVYLTEDPLALRSKDLKGNSISQKDITESLKGITQIDESTKLPKTIEILKNGMFKDSVAIDSQTYCFVHSIGGNFNEKRNPLNDTYIQIDVIVPDKYDMIVDSETGIKISRGYAIGIILSDLLDEMHIDDDNYSDIVGNLYFRLVSSNVERLAKTNDGVVYSWVYKTKTRAGRVDE